jgi:hypothetical protein
MTTPTVNQQFCAALELCIFEPQIGQFGAMSEPTNIISCCSQQD